ncbi:MAG: DUF885 domain-containing protein [Opitutia bacterium]|nr:MAG: DUF885 domain-containing protein [Opitutae bacterium]
MRKTLKNYTLAVAFCGALAAPALAADSPLETFFRRYLDERFALHPTEATALGEHRFDDRMDDLSPAALEKSLAHLKQSRARLHKEIDRAKLSPDERINFDIFNHELEASIWVRENTQPFATNPRAYNEYISDSVFLILTQSRLPKETNVANAIGRMKQIPNVVAAAKANLKHPPRAVLETAIKQNKGSIGFYESDLFETVGQTAQLAALKAEAARVVPTLKDYQQWLEKELLPRATDEWRLGKRKFSKKLEYTLNAGLSADEVLRDAEAEFTRVHNDMYVIARQLWHRYFPATPLPVADPAGKRETVAKVIAAVSKEHSKPEELLADARAQVDSIKKFIREKNILRLPEPDRCQIIAMPEFQRGNSLAYLNAAPALDPEAPSFYAISPPAKDWTVQRTKSLLEEYNRHMLQILTIHEAYPGHYVQLEYSSRAPSLLRRVLGSGVMIEGWAVYTEQMMLDQGYGAGPDELQLRLNQLKFYLRAVCNSILDHKLHCANMSDDDAIRLMVEGAFQSQEEASLKLVRAKQTSTQLSTYFVGRMAHVRMREQMQRELGDKFNLARYHEAVLSQGSVPMKYLPELVRAKLK